jgi:hypothetical protein
MKYLIIVLFITVNIAFAQKDSTHNFELTGNLQYNYTHYSDPYGYYANFYHKQHTLIIQPELGYYLFDRFEIFTDLEYQLQLDYHNSLESIDSWEEVPASQINSDFVTHRIGFYFGMGYNYSLSKIIDLFLGTKIGISTSRVYLHSEGFQTIHSGTSTRVENVNANYDSGWRGTEVSFPSFVLSLKVYPNDDLIILLKAQYTKINNYNGSDNTEFEQTTFGIGLGTSFGL